MGKAESPQTLISLADQAMARNQLSTALIHLKNAAKQDPENPFIRLKLADLFVRTGQGVQAEVELDKARRKGASAKQTAVLAAKSKLILGQFDDITKDIDLLDLPQSEIARLRAIQGHAFFEQRKFTQAMQMFQRAWHLAPEELEVQLGRVRWLKMKNQMKASKKLLEQLLTTYPDRAEVLIIAGNFYRETARYQKALDYYQQAGEIQPRNVNVWFGVVRTYIAMKNFGEAKREIQKVLVNYPEHQVANYLLSVIAFEEGDYNRAKAAIDIVLKGDKRKYEALKLLSTIQFQQKNYTEAENNLGKYLKLHPSDKDAKKTLAAIYLKRNQGVLALGVLKELEHLNDSYLYSMMATAYTQIGDKKKAAEYFNRSLKLAADDPSILHHIQRTKLAAGETLDIQFTDQNFKNFAEEGHIPILNLLRKKEYPEAIRIIQGYLQKSPNNALLHYLLGTAYLFQNQTEKARNSFNQSIKLDPKLIESRIYLAKIYQKSGDERAAEKQYREVLRVHKNNDQAMVALAGIYARQENTSEMLKWLNKSRRENSASLASREVLESYYRKQGDLKKALEVAKEMVSIQPQNVELLLKLANDQKALRQYSGAIKTFKKIVAAEADQPDSWMGIGRLYYLNGNLKEAEKSFRKVLTLAPDNLTAKVIIDQILLSTKRLDQALKLALTIQREHPQSSAGFNMAGDIYIAMKKPGKAIRQYRKSITLQYDSDTYLKLFSAYNRDNQTDKGFAELTKWTKQYPKDMALKEALAITYDKRGHTEQAFDLYQQILQKVRGNDRLLNSAALVALKLKSPMSVEYADLAHSIRPQSARNKATFGWVLFQNNNDVAKAEVLLKEAVNAAPSNPDYRYHLAVLLASQGRKAEALKNLYLTMGTENEFKNKAAAIKLINRLKNG